MEIMMKHWWESVYWNTLYINNKIYQNKTILNLVILSYCCQITPPICLTLIIFVGLYHSCSDYIHVAFGALFGRVTSHLRDVTTPLSGTVCRP